MSDTPPLPPTGLRELKKQRTRWALIDAALDLFTEHGYEATTIDDIVAAADVSQRTYFRYFAGKEDVALDILGEYDAVFVRTLEQRPPEESPIRALRASLWASLDAIEHSGELHGERFRKLRTLIENTPALAAGELRRYGETEQRLAAVVADRMGVDLAADVRPYLLISSFMAIARTALESCARADIVDPAEMVPRVKEIVDLAVETLPAEWSR